MVQARGFWDSASSYREVKVRSGEKQYRCEALPLVIVRLASTDVVRDSALILAVVTGQCRKVRSADISMHLT